MHANIAPQSASGVAAEIGCEERADRRASDGFLAEVDERRCRPGRRGRSGRRMRSSSGQRSGRRARNVGDSGRKRRRTTATTSGSAPPRTKSVRQPNTGMTYPATNAASVPPSGTQTMVKVMANGRCRRGTYSDASAAALGMAPPRPRPARKRRTASAQRLSTSAAAAVRTPKMKTLPMSAKRRPIRSPTRPASAPPIIMPTMPLARTGANAPRGTAQSRIMAGTAMPSSWLSTPSKTMVSAVSRTNSFCRLLQRPSSRRWPISTGWRCAMGVHYMVSSRSVSDLMRAAGTADQTIAI